MARKDAASTRKEWKRARRHGDQNKTRHRDKTPGAARAKAATRTKRRRRTGRLANSPSRSSPSRARTARPRTARK
jgi:hypothetical protein